MLTAILALTIGVCGAFAVYTMFILVFTAQPIQIADINMMINNMFIVIASLVLIRS
jgi:hypothetical protein